MRLSYIEEQWNEPDRKDYYLMQIAAEIRGVLRKQIPKLDTFKIPFEWSGSQKPKMTKEQATVAAKSKWLSWLGAFGGKKTKGKDGKEKTLVRRRVKHPDGTIEEC